MTENRDARSEWEVDVLDEIRAELSAVRPSPEFAARVRARIAPISREDKPARALGLKLDWRWLLPASVAALIIVGVGLSPWRSESHLQPEAPTQIAVQQPVLPAAPARVDRVLPQASRAAGTIRAATVSPAPAIAEPPLEVITTQPAILQEMWARAGALSNLVAPPVPGRPVEIGEVVVAPIEIEPVIVKWLVEPPTPAGLFPIIRRMAADAAERSAK